MRLAAARRAPIHLLFRRREGRADAIHRAKHDWREVGRNAGSRLRRTE
jgi:hypothetical protein